MTLRKFAKITISFVVGAALAALTAILLLPYAYDIRGYSTVGGEWLIILIVGLLVYMVSYTLLKWR